jgi:hypothetical protein
MEKYEQHGNNKRIKPKTTTAKIIYNSIYAPNINDQRFIPTWDSTDHFSFCCEKCKTVADILKIDFAANFPKEPSDWNKKCSTMYFYMGCKNCGTTGMRKIYIEYPHGTAVYHETFDGKTNRAFIFKEDKPYGYVQMKPEGEAVILEKETEKKKDDTH